MNRQSKRAHRLRASHSFGFVLVLVVSVFVCAAGAPDGSWTGSALLLLQALAFAAALWTSGRAQPKMRTAAGVLLAGVTAGVLSPLVSRGTTLTAAVSLLTGVLVAATIVVVALGIIDQGNVNRQSVIGAICVYLLLGLFFVFVYSVVAVLEHGDLFSQGTDGTRAVRVYFSFVTLTTVGYGDYTPATNAGRMLAVAEALVGQLYLVTVVALLVSRIGARRHAE